MRVAELDTPALVVDLEIMERNLRRAADYTVAHGLRFRPHTKTHKIPSLAIRQLKLGAVGFTVAKFSEAEVMLGAWPGDRLLEYPTIGYRKLRRLAEIARAARVTVAVDSHLAAFQLFRSRRGNWHALLHLGRS
jgi:D-serine deaminase-like pyridoxal phosphate-dependent protein